MLTHDPLQHRIPPPQLVPSATVREHARDSVVATFAHAPVRQVGVVIVRDCVPVVSHAFANPPHAPQAPVVTVPQLVPSVSRVQACMSVLAMSAHDVPEQVGVVTDRVRVPDSSHVDENVHMPNVPY